MSESINHEWRCKKCRKTLFKYDNELSGFTQVQCPDTKCKYLSNLLFYKGKGYEINEKLQKKKSFLQEALKDLPTDLVNDIMDMLSK